MIKYECCNVNPVEQRSGLVQSVPPRLRSLVSRWQRAVLKSDDKRGKGLMCQTFGSCVGGLAGDRKEHCVGKR